MCQLPPPETKIWRYIREEKLFSLFEKESLFFAKASVLKDPFEGRYPKGFPRIRSGGFDRGGFDRTPFDRQFCNYIPKEVKESVYICCFTMNEYENYSSWDVYFNSRKTDSHQNDGVENGAAIQSSLSRLKNSLELSEDDVAIRQVNYYTPPWKDEIKQLFSSKKLITLFSNKRQGYSFENEIRAIITKPPNNHTKHEKGIFIPINVQNFVEKIVISPGASKDFEDKIRSLCLEKGLGTIVSRSTLEDTPEF